MRFKASIVNIHTFTRLIASLSSLGKDAWLQLTSDHLRWTVVPEQGSQVWAALTIDTIFEPYTIQSATENNTINLRVPLASLLRALRSAISASSASIRLTKKDNIPVLSLTIVTDHRSTRRSAAGPAGGLDLHDPSSIHHEGTHETDAFGGTGHPPTEGANSWDRETTITQDIPVIVLAPTTVAAIHQPHCPEPDVHIILPSLLQLKAISERYTKLALSTSSSGSGGAPTSSRSFANNPSSTNGGARLADNPSTSSSSSSRLLLSANMHGVLKIGVETPMLKIESKWEGLTNPELDPTQVEGGEVGVREHASTKMKERHGEEAWSTVRVEGRDWGRVLGVGRLGGRVVACFCHDRALILYVYLSDDASDSVLTYYITSYSA